jgi:hypothetical protein
MVTDAGAALVVGFVIGALFVLAALHEWLRGGKR